MHMVSRTVYSSACRGNSSFFCKSLLLQVILLVLYLRTLFTSPDIFFLRLVEVGDLVSGGVQIGDSQTISNSLSILNKTLNSLQNAEDAITSSNLTQSTVRNLMATAQGVGNYLESFQDIILLSNCSAIQSVYQTTIQDQVCYEIQR
jgi:hypothetical protein